MGVSVYIPDLHGSDIFKLINPDEYDNIIFTGDYFDSFSYSDEEHISMFFSLLEFKKKYKEKITLLIGNHDDHYFNFPHHVMGGGYRTTLQKRLTAIVTPSVLEYFKPISVIGNIVASHAGISSIWYSLFKKEFVKQFDEEFLMSSSLEDAFNAASYSRDLRSLFNMVDKRRNGSYTTGGIYWIDQETLKIDGSFDPNYVQVVGHSQLFTGIEYDQDNKIFFIDNFPNFQRNKNGNSIHNPSYTYQVLEVYNANGYNLFKTFDLHTKERRILTSLKADNTRTI